MKRITTCLHRSLMFILALLPPACALFRALLSSFWTGVLWLTGQTLVTAVISLLPAFIGNYREYDTLRYEGGMNNSDPNPDREVRHELVREGHRFPLRLTVDLIFAAVNLLLLCLLPKSMYASMNGFLRLAFWVLMTLAALLAMASLPATHCLWTDIPGIIAGAVGYLAMAIYLQTTSADVSGLRVVISVGALIYLFVGSVTLNRQSIAMSMATHAGDTPRAPRQIARKNRRIVLGFATVATLFSLLEPMRAAILWVVYRAGDAILWFLRLLRGGGGEEVSSELPMELFGAGAPVTDAASAAVEVADADTGSYLIVYIFLGVVGAGALWMIFGGLVKLVKKVGKWMEKFAANINEGFYDEREQLMTADEMRRHMKNAVKNRLKSMFTRETPYEKLSGRDRVRRVLRDFYKKRGRRENSLRTMTAREAIHALDTAHADKLAFAELYDRARYSQKDVSEEEADKIKKDARL